MIGTVRWLEMLAVGVYTYDSTGSATLVALMMFARQVPMVLLGAVAGTVAEGLDRRLVLLVELGALVAVSVVLALLSFAGTIALWHLALGAFLGGCYFATDLPVRRTMLGEIAGAERVGPAMALDSANNNATRMVGPLIGGTVYQALGLDAAFIVSAVLYAVAFVLILPLDYAGLAQSTFRSGVGFLASLAEGLRYVRRERQVMGTLAVTVIANMFGFPYAAMVPVVGRDVLALKASWIGALMSAEGLGAFLGAILLAGLARPPLYMTIYRTGTLLFMTCLLAFSLSSWFALSWPLLFVAGLGVAGFSAMQSTIIFRSAPPELRSRIMGVLAMCIGAGPIGTLHLGLMADLLGVQNAVTLIAVEGLVALALVWFAFRR